MDQPGFAQDCQSRYERGPADGQALHEILEAVDAQKCLSQDEQHPAIAEYAAGAANRARSGRGDVFAHATHIAIASWPNNGDKVSIADLSETADDKFAF